MEIIYLLCCPTTSQPKYIGKTSKSLDKRVVQHMNERKNPHTYRVRWLEKLRREGLSPTAISLFVVPQGSDWSLFERFTRRVDRVLALKAAKNASLASKKKLAEDPIAAASLSEKRKALWLDPDYRAKVKAGMAEKARRDRFESMQMELPGGWV